MELRPDQVWAFALGNFDRLNKERVVIAHDTFGIEVCLTMYDDEIYAIVYYGEKPLYSERIMNSSDAEMTITKMYIEYLKIPEDEANPPELGDDEMTEEELHQEMEDTIYEREDSLFLAAVSFLTEVLCIDETDKSAEDAILEDYEIDINDFIDAIMELLAKKFFISTYRPTFTPEEGAPFGEVVDEFPYEKMVQSALRKEKKKKKNKDKKE